MTFLSATQIGKKVCLSYQKVNKILVTQNLYNESTKRPTEYAIENGMVKTHVVERKSIGQIVEFNVWNYEKITIYFKTPTDVEKIYKFNNPTEPLSKICEAFADFGGMLKIEGYDSKKKGINPKSIEAVVQSCFGDPHFLGLKFFHRFMNREEAESARSKTLPLANELYKAAKKIDAKRAKSNLLVIEAILTWMCNRSQ